ncbi:MAG: thioredoxin 1 [Puniceicoccaceae bacterium 5H]|nr:MAG: thioredoxin 1 [Puniceicoccaceae bacterium 5H]
MSEAIVNLNEANFEEVVTKSDKVVVVDFWAPWCGPCRTIAPILEQLAQEMSGEVQVTKVNVDENQALAQKFNVRGIPTLLFFKDGELRDQSVGLVQKEAIAKKVKELN